MPAKNFGSCIACKHVDRARIDAGLKHGVKFAALEKSFGISQRTLSRHLAGHVQMSEPHEIAIVEPVRLDDPQAVMTELEWCYFQLKKQAVESAGVDPLSVNRSVSSGVLVLKEIGKAMGMFGDTVTVNVNKHRSRSDEYFDSLSPAQVEALLVRCEKNDPSLLLEMSEMIDVTPDHAA